MAILERHNENNRRQAIANANWNLKSDNNFSMLPTSNNSNKMSMMNSNLMSSSSRNRFSCNSSEAEAKETNGEGKIEDISHLKDEDEVNNNNDTKKKEERIKRNTLSTLDPYQAQITSARFQETIKSKIKPHVGFKISEEKEEEEEKKKEEEEEEEE